MKLNERMKNNYESRTQTYLTRRTPVIMRLDGKAFHTFTKKFSFPFDINLLYSLYIATKRLGKEIQGSKFAYIQSDEISILITDYDRLNTEAWFNYNVQKMCSVASSIFSCYFNEVISNLKPEIGHQHGFFDCRVFNIPEEEVVNYFIWRQRDWWRNSISMLTRAYYSHKECLNKSVKDMHEMLYEKGANWNDLSPLWKNGQCVDLLNQEPVILEDFNNYRNYFNKFLEPIEEE